MDNTKTGLDWSGIIGLLVIAGVFNSGFGFNGGAYSNALTRAELDNEFTQRDIFNVNTSLLQGNTALTTEILNNRFNCNQNACNTQKEVLQSRYDGALGFANIDKDILLGNQNILSNADKCCCELKTAIHSEGEQTRALIQANTIQDLRDKVADKDRELLATGLSYGNTITANNLEERILNKLGRYVPYGPLYTPYGTTTTYGTTIQ